MSVDKARKQIERWASYPEVFVREALGATPELWQSDALNAIRDHDRVSIRSGHGVGKTALLSWLILWWICTRMPSKIACTAPTAHQLEDVLWAELQFWHGKLPKPLRDALTWKRDALELTDEEDKVVSFAVARTARKENPEAFQGFHSPNMLFLGDEASGIDDIIFEVGRGAMSTPGAKTILTGNPTKAQGYFHDTHTKMRHRWHTMRVSSADSTQVAKTYPEEIAEEFGIDSNIYRVRVLGEFPTSDDDAVIPLELCEAAVYRDVEDSDVYREVWGLDVARFGDDETALAKRKGNVQTEKVRIWRGDTMETVGRVMSEYRDLDPLRRPSEIIVDSIGLGAGVVDRLRELGLPVRGINVGEIPSSGKYARLRDELWWRCRDWLDNRDCRLLDDDKLIGELTGPKYKYASSGKIEVEKKDDMKKRGLKSPNRADAWNLTFAGGMERIEDHRMERYRPKRQRAVSWMAA